MNTPSLWKHQAEGISHGLVNRDFAYFWEMGTGKTRVTIEVLRRRFAQENRIMRTIILGPSVVLKNWKAEILQYSKLRDRDILVLDKSGKKRLQEFIRATSDDGDGVLYKGKVVITNYEAMQMEELVQAFHDWGPEILVCDESHRCKNIKSKRAKQVVRLSDKTKHNYLLTGTPILNDAQDVFNQFRILDGGETLGQNFYAFRGKYFEDSNSKWAGKPNYFPKWEPRPELYSHLSEKIYRKAMRVIKDECLDLPPLVTKNIEVEMSTEQAKAYNDMKKDYIAFIEDKENDKAIPKAVVAQLAITKALRLQQIVSGFAKTDEGETYRFKSCPRLTALSELLADITPQAKVIVWAVFKHNYGSIREICEKLGVGYSELHGGISKSDREIGINNFRNDPGVKVMVANQGAGGIGINLVEAAYSIYYSRNFSLEQDLQSEARNRRGGSEIHEKITRINLVTPNSIDELVSEAIQNKQDISTAILDWKEKL